MQVGKITNLWCGFYIDYMLFVSCSFLIKAIYLHRKLKKYWKYIKHGIRCLLALLCLTRVSILDWLQLMDILLTSRKHCFLLEAAQDYWKSTRAGGGVKLSTSVLRTEKTCASESWARVLFYIMSLTSTKKKKPSSKTMKELLLRATLKPFRCVSMDTPASRGEIPLTLKLHNWNCKIGVIAKFA